MTLKSILEEGIPERQNDCEKETNNGNYFKFKNRQIVLFLF